MDAARLPPRSEAPRADPAPPRHATCAAVLHVAPLGGGAPRPSGLRRCPFGVIVDLDCPERHGVGCAFHREAPPAGPVVLAAAELERLAQELGAAGYPRGRYLERVRPLWGLGAATRRPLPALPDPSRACLAAEEAEARSRAALLEQVRLRTQAASTIPSAGAQGVRP